MSKIIQKYKALMIDVDGTLVPNEKEGMPSKKVASAITEANKLIHVGIATNRPLFLVEHIFEHLKLSGPSIVNGGGQVIDIASKKVYYRQPVENEDINKVYQITKSKGLFLRLDNDEEEISYTSTCLLKRFWGCLYQLLSSQMQKICARSYQRYLRYQRISRQVGQKENGLFRFHMQKGQNNMQLLK